jgi:hypothetical protein
MIGYRASTVQWTRFQNERCKVDLYRATSAYGGANLHPFYMQDANGWCNLMSL